jgi:hypothetical protein
MVAMREMAERHHDERMDAAAKEHRERMDAADAEHRERLLASQEGMSAYVREIGTMLEGLDAARRAQEQEIEDLRTALQNLLNRVEKPS